MAFSSSVRENYKSQLQSIRDAGTFKIERFIHSAQAADIEVEFPTALRTGPIVGTILPGQDDPHLLP